MNDRTPVDDLVAADEGMGKRFIELRDAISAPASSLSSPWTAEDHSRVGRHQAANRLAGLLSEIREKKQFADFMSLPSDPQRLTAYALNGPIIFVNSSKFGSDALIITAQDVTSVPLPKFEREDILRNYEMLFAAIGALGSEQPNIKEANEEYEKVMTWLWEAVAKPVLDSVDFSQYNVVPDAKPRLFWVSTGFIGVFPIHACGQFNSLGRSGTSDTVHDRVISSYIPSLRALAYARDRLERISQQTKFEKVRALLVGMPTTPGMDPLDVRGELGTVKQKIEIAFDVVEIYTPMRDQVLRNLKLCSLVHFACHGVADPDDPSMSTLRLEDWMENPLSVRTLLKTSLSSCQLAYLSACESARNKDMLLRDEGINIAGAFHMAGVPHTISTLWPISDTLSSTVASAFYEGLLGENNTVDINRSARALHSAIGRQRRHVPPVEPILWGAYIHSGA